MEEQNSSDDRHEDPQRPLNEIEGLRIFSLDESDDDIDFSFIQDPETIRFVGYYSNFNLYCTSNLNC